MAVTVRVWSCGSPGPSMIPIRVKIVGPPFSLTDCSPVNEGVSGTSLTGVSVSVAVIAWPAVASGW